jgi:DNA polymerase-3 subunit epsilon
MRGRLFTSGGPAPRGSVEPSNYAVIDVETTGLFPAKHDRVVEVGVVHVDEDGQVEDEWSTLVNPERDVGPTHIHGITAREVLNAPTFADLAPYVLRAIAGRTVVAHNAVFDLMFLAAESHRAGLPLMPGGPTGLCTMRWSTHFLDAPSRKLADCCAAAGVALQAAHTALGDAHATAMLLACYLQNCGRPAPWSEELAQAARYCWPAWDREFPQISMVRRANGAPARNGAWLDRIVAGMPRVEDPAVETYLQVLESAMLDRYLSAHEEQALVGLAGDLGLSRDRVLDLHRRYLHGLAAVAWADGVVTPLERRELDEAAALLGLPAHYVEQLLAAAADIPTSAEHGFRLVVGDRVVFTGDMQLPRAEWVTRAEQAGLVVGGVTKTTKVVVAADPDSLSGKAGKARGYGIPVVTEDAFARILGEMG